MEEHERDTLPAEEQGPMWEFVLANERRLRWMCSRFAGVSADADDLWDETLNKMPRLWRRHKGTPEKIFAHMRWYLWKYIKRRWDRDPLGWRWSQGERPECASESDGADDRLEVKLILEELDEGDAVLLWQRFAVEHTLGELAEAMGTNRVVAGEMCRDALKRAKEVVDAERTRGGRADEL